MIGVRVGTKAGAMGGVRVGVSADEIAPQSAGVTWTVDATSGISIPSTATEWSSFIAAKGLSISGPNGLWLCQEASGNLADSIGSLTLTAGGAPLYQQAVSGWSAKATKLRNGIADRFVAAAGLGPNPTTTSSFWLALASTPTTPASARRIIHISDGATPCFARMVIAPALSMTIAAASTDGVSNPTAVGVQPIGLMYDRANSKARVYTSQEKISGTYNSGVVDGNKGLGAPTGTAADQFTVYFVMWSGAGAEMSDAQVKALLQAMGFTIPWT